MDSKKFIEIKKPVEEVREIESEISLETPKVEETGEAKVSGQPESSERDEDKDAQIATKIGIGAASAITGVVCPPAGAALAASGGLTGFAMESIADDTDNEELRKAAKIVGHGTSIGGSVGSTTGKVLDKVGEEVAKEAFKETAKNA